MNVCVPKNAQTDLNASARESLILNASFTSSKIKMLNKLKVNELQFLQFDKYKKSSS